MATLALLGGMAVLSSRIELSDLLAFFPLVFLVFYGIGERLDHWLAAGEGSLGLVLTMTVFFCLAGGAIVMPGGAGPAGVLLLPVVPCVVLLVGLERERIFRYRGMYLILAFLVLIGVVNGYEPAKDSYRASLYNAERVAFIRSNTAAGDVVVFGDRGSMEHAGPLFFDRVFLIAGREEGMRTILGKLRDRGIHLCHLWTMDRSLVFRFGNPYGEDRRDVFPPPGGSGRSPGFSLIRLDVGRAIEALEKGRHNGRTRYDGMMGKKTDTAGPASPHPLNMLYFYLTEGCNLRCRHCWIEPPFQAESEQYPALDTELFRHIVRQAKAAGPVRGEAHGRRAPHAPPDRGDPGGCPSRGCQPDRRDQRRSLHAGSCPGPGRAAACATSPSASTAPTRRPTSGSGASRGASRPRSAGSGTSLRPASGPRSS